uniref:Uncharacterized protein n=1 Tax=Anguilla anguilla TaxID=7936 RepID=A0A0E9V151_ANGAN
MRGGLTQTQRSKTQNSK